MAITNKQLHKLTLFLWSLMLIVSGLSLFFLYDLNVKIDQERIYKNDNLRLIELSYKLKIYSDYLTSEARNFVVTSNVEHLQNYWDEVLINKNRDKIIDDLRLHHLSKNDKQLLVESKQNSDILIQTEARAMKLVLSAYAIKSDLYPNYLKDFNLSVIDEKLTPVEKIRKAQNLMFDKEYYAIKDLITSPVRVFNKNIQTQSNMELLEFQGQTSTNIVILYSLLMILVLLLVTMVWMKILLLQRLQNEE